MSLSKIPTEWMLYNGAAFGAGLLGVFLWRKDVLPKYMGIISIGAASFGLCTIIWQILRRKDDKRSNIDFRPIDAFYEEIASQVNEELSQQSSQSGGSEVKRHTVDENEEFDPIAYLKCGEEILEIYNKQKGVSGREDYLKTLADCYRLREAFRRDTKVDRSTSVNHFELSISEDEDERPISEMGVKKKRDITLNLSKIKLSPSDAISEFKGSSQNIPELFKEWETAYPEIEKEIKGIKWTDNRLRLRKILGAAKKKNEKK